MQSLLIRGGRPLAGEIRISGGKNAVLPILAGTVMCRERCVIRECPKLSDVDAALDILRYLGAVVSRDGDTITVDPRPVERWDIPRELMNKMRGSVFFIGPLMARFGRCRLSQPGGCPLGHRPVDFHLMGLQRLGAQVSWEEELVCQGSLTGGDILLPYPSVGATENLIMAALGAGGMSVIRNCAREPEIVCLCDFFRKCGCRIEGDGTGQICVWGGMPGGAEHKLIPDRMETATFLCAVASAGGSARLRNTDASHLEQVLDVLRLAGCRVDAQMDTIYISAHRLTSPGFITTGPYPAFPTDAQAPIMAALLRADGETRIQETVFSSRMHHIPALQAMGADITSQGDTARIRGVARLRGACVEALDLRGGAALAIAALAAEGTTTITGLRHLLRGYEDFAGKLAALGAEVSCG